MTPELKAALERSKTWWNNATEEQREDMIQKQRESWARGMAPCEHGDPDWETCPDCAAQREASND